MGMTAEKPPHLKFEDDLAELIDRYLLDGIDIADMKDVLRSEAENNHDEIRSGLRARSRRDLRNIGQKRSPVPFRHRRKA